MIRGLPYDAELEFLESTGTQYIDTGVKPSSDLRTKFRAAYTHTPIENNSTIFGSRSTASSNDRYWLNYDSKFEVGYGSYYNTGVTVSPGEMFDVDFNYIENGDHKFKINDSVFTYSGTPNTTIGIILFGRIVGAQVTRCSSRFYSAQFFRNGVLVRDLIPVRVGSGSSAVGYMYDRVSKRLFGNAGSGAFVLGPDKAVPILSLHRYASPSNGVALGKMGCTDLFHRITARDYVQNGLVAMWDGIENAGWGVHDSTANYWKELVSNTNSQVLDSAFTWGDDFLSTQGGTRSSTALYPSGLLADRAPGTAYSMEVVYRDYVSGGAMRQLLSAASNPAIRISSYMRGGLEQFDIRFNNRSYYIYEENSSIVAGSHNVTMTCDGVNAKVYIDGKYVAPTAGGGIGTLTPASSVAYFAWENPTAHREKYCRLALHKYALTADEIARNYAIDKARFHLP